MMASGTGSDRATGAAQRHVARPGDALRFLLLTFVLTWVPWLGLVLGPGDVQGAAGMALWVLGGYGPTIAALVLIGLRDGRAGLGRFLRRLLQWRLGWWYLTVLLPLPVVLIAATYAVVTGQADWAFAAPWHWLLAPVALATGVIAGGMEELGWRGYLLPLMQARMSALTASIGIGVLWALWHAPLFLLGSASQASFPPGWYLLQTVALSVILTWLYNDSRGSLLLAVLFHGAVNGWFELVVAGAAPDAVPGMLPASALLLTCIAIAVVLRFGPTDLARHPRQRAVQADTPPTSEARPRGET
jgi:uncharacterized protein